MIYEENIFLGVFMKKISSLQSSNLYNAFLGLAHKDCWYVFEYDMAC